jgi:hypothetical protein
MKLVEFDLDAPQAAKAVRHAYREESRTVTSLYERCFRGLKVKRGWKVLVECVPAVERAGVRDLLGVLTVQVEFDLERYRSLPPARKKEVLLECLDAGIRRVVLAEGWPLQPFEDARNCVLAKRFENEWVWGKEIWGPGRWYRAHLLCRHDLDAFRAWLVVQDREGSETTRAQILELRPSEFVFVPKLGQIKWLSGNRVALLAKDLSEVGRVEVPT